MKSGRLEVSKYLGGTTGLNRKRGAVLCVLEAADQGGACISCESKYFFLVVANCDQGCCHFRSLNGHLSILAKNAMFLPYLCLRAKFDVR